MAEEKETTGYPSIDKPWLRYYTEDAINSVPFKGSIYKHIYDRNGKYMDNWALQYFGRKISYKALFIETNIVATALTE